MLAFSLSDQFASESAMLKMAVIQQYYEHEQGFAHLKYACNAGYSLPYFRPDQIFDTLFQT